MISSRFSLALGPQSSGSFYLLLCIHKKFACWLKLHRLTCKKEVLTWYEHSLYSYNWVYQLFSVWIVSDNMKYACCNTKSVQVQCKGSLMSGSSPGTLCSSWFFLLMSMLLSRNYLTLQLFYRKITSGILDHVLRIITLSSVLLMYPHTCKHTIKASPVFYIMLPRYMYATLTHNTQLYKIFNNLIICWVHYSYNNSQTIFTNNFHKQ